MRKRLVRPLAYLSSVVMLASSMNLTALAASSSGDWVRRGNDWYYEKNGEVVRDEWRDSNGIKYWLGDDGRMVYDQLIEDGDKTYYVDVTGARVTNQWKLLRVDGYDDDRWYYFDNNGRAYEDGWKTINGKRYHFTDSMMDYGWLDAEGRMLSEDGEYDETDWAEATYYCGDNSTGWRFDNQWVQVDDYDETKYTDKDCIWVWLGSNGKKAVDKTVTIGNKRYTFNEEGAMMTEWYGSATPSNADYKYYDNPDGDRVDGKWFQAVPSEDQDATDYHNDTLRWFYANKSGVTYKDSIKSIAGKRYLFDENGIMRNGFVVVNDGKYVRSLGGYDENGHEDSMPSVSDITSVNDGVVMFFDGSGARKTGRFKMELDGDDVYLKFKTNGEAVHGVDSGYLYDHGVQLDSDGEKYAIVTLDGKDYLINKSGKIQKAGKHTDSSNDIIYTVTGDNTTGYTITVEYKQ